MQLRQIPVYPRPYLDKVDRRELAGELIPLNNFFLQRRAYRNRRGGWRLRPCDVCRAGVEQQSDAER